MSEDQQPLLRVVRGRADDMELAALTAVVAGIAAQPVAEPATPTRSRWADRASSLRRAQHPGPGAWRASSFPR